MSTTIVRQQNQLGILNASDDKLLKKLQSKFTEDEQQLFVQSFLMYLNHDQETEYIVDLDDVWQWMGFSRKDPAKKLLEKHFERDVHYKIQLQQALGQVHGGHNKETILMNIKTFKRMCLKAGTKKADDVHNYYIKMEETLHEYLLENAKRQAKLEREKALIESFDKKPVNYLGSLQVDGEDFWKFGESDDLYNRIKKLKKELGESFVVEVVVECERNFLLETKFKAHHEIVSRRTQKVINGKLQTELLKLDDKCNDKDVKRIYSSIKEEIQTEVDKQRHHEQKMLELNIKQSELAIQQTDRDIQLRKLDVELKKLDIQSRLIDVQAHQTQSPQACHTSNIRSMQPAQGQVRSSGPKKVSQYSLDGQFLQTFNSLKAAATHVHGNRKTLGAVCGTETAYKDYIWKLVE